MKKVKRKLKKELYEKLPFRIKMYIYNIMRKNTRKTRRMKRKL